MPHSFLYDIGGIASFCDAVFLGTFNFFLVRTISKKELGNNGMTPYIGKKLQFRSINAIIIWALATILAPLIPLIVPFIFILIFVFQVFGNLYFKKKIVAHGS